MPDRVKASGSSSFESESETRKRPAALHRKTITRGLAALRRLGHPFTPSVDLYMYASFDPMTSSQIVAPIHAELIPKLLVKFCSVAEV